MTPPPDTTESAPGDATTPLGPLESLHTPHGVQRFVFSATAIALCIAALHYGRSVLMPLAFAALLAFVLEPVVAWLRRRRVPHVAAVVTVIVLTLMGLTGAATVVGQQIVALSAELPTHRATIQKKLQALRPSGQAHPVLAEAARVVGMLEKEVGAARDAVATGAAGKESAPTKVLVEPAPPSPLRALGDMLAPVLMPLATAGFVVVLLIFMLLQRREMVDRIVRLSGGNLHLMADAMNESATRVSRYLGAQVLVNVGYGIPMAAGLWWLDVPGAMLWGFLAAVLRFVPYLGPAVAALFPLLMAFAIDPGWTIVGWTLALIVFLELVSNNVVEPLAYGGSTGVSPVAVLLSAAFWALLWGPVGLIVATPLTVCIVVIGRHLGPLRSLGVLLGSAPAFDKPTQLYQRLISGDEEEAIELAQEEAARTSLQSFYNDSAVPMLALAAQTSTEDATAAHRHRVVSGTARIIEALREDTAVAAPAAAASVLCLGARNELDTLSAEMLVHLLQAQGHAARAVPAVSLAAETIAALDLQGVATAFVCSYHGAPQTHTRYLCRRLRKRVPSLRIVLCAWAAPAELLLPGAAAELGVDAVAVTLDEAAAHAGQAPAAPAAAPATAAAASSVDAAAASATAWRDALARGAQRAVEVFDVPLAGVVVRAEGGQWLQVSAGVPTWTTPDFTATPSPGSPLAQVLDAGELLVVPDLRREPQFAPHQEARLEGLPFFAAAPLRAEDGSVLGAIVLHDVRARPFSDDDEALLTAMAQALADDVAELLREAVDTPAAAAATVLPVHAAADDAATLALPPQARLSHG